MNNWRIVLASPRQARNSLNRLVAIRLCAIAASDFRSFTMLRIGLSPCSYFFFVCSSRTEHAARSAVSTARL
jgi:hypothetical protein